MMQPQATSSARTYVDFEPHFEWARTDDSDTLLVDVSGFKKEELRVQIDTSGAVKVSGERDVGGNRWSRFRKTFQMPNDCNVKGIKAKLDEGLLYVILPKKTTQVHPSDQTVQPHQSPARASQETNSNVGREEQKMPEKEEQENVIAKSKDDPWGEDVSSRERLVAPKSKVGALVMGLSKYKHLIVSVVMATAVIVGLGIYARLGNFRGGDNN